MSADHYQRSLLNFFAAYSLNRLSHKRQDVAWVQSIINQAQSKFIVTWRSKVLVSQQDPSQACFFTYDDLAERIEAGEPIFLGQAEDDSHYFALDLDLAQSEPLPTLANPKQFFNLRLAATRIPAKQGTLLAYAQAMTYWHKRNRFCGDCGQPTQSRDAGHMRVCSDPDCGQKFFPRTDPAVIVLIQHKDMALLGRKPNWPPNRYSTIAGFVEPGESVEAAVIREAFEETGVSVTGMEYHSSQPWPFPRSVMLGYHAHAPALQEPHFADDELEEARWISRAGLKKGLQEGTFLIPPDVSIAYRLIEAWFNAGHEGQLADYMPEEKF